MPSEGIWPPAPIDTCNAREVFAWGRLDERHALPVLGIRQREATKENIFPYYLERRARAFDIKATAALILTSDERRSAGDDIEKQSNGGETSAGPARRRIKLRHDLRTTSSPRVTISLSRPASRLRLNAARPTAPLR
ncbi:hypothetical protein EVAR_93255_1 [Eumeta japonica]|uniref:Uncharacterized protein n=1 Tax=Eumeta variegata TaxID=151549 RepID=A0A4C1TXT4_EUMVA|nr:hypothetical protein EVAR_93255_1 [Eumeta japonica]